MHGQLASSELRLRLVERSLGRPARPVSLLEETHAFLRATIGEFAGRIATVSSFGAESAVLLALVAEIDPAMPVLFIDTGMHFTETLDYVGRLSRHLGLRELRVIGPTGADRAAHDPEGELWRFDPDACCRFRKTTPLDRALAPFDAWINGRKRYQAATRAALPRRERAGRQVKLNPLAAWTASDVAREFARRDLPAHPLGSAGFASIGCAPCTRAVALGEDPRSGRWAGTGKVECGIHQQPPHAG